MPLMKNSAFDEIALKIRDACSPYITEQGCIEDAQLMKVIREVTGQQIRSERSLHLINVALTEL